MKKETDEEKRITAQEVVSKLNSIKGDAGEEERRNILDLSTLDRMINNNERWNLAQVWQVKDPLTAVDSPTSFSQLVVTKYPMVDSAPSLIVIYNFKKILPLFT